MLHQVCWSRKSFTRASLTYLDSNIHSVIISFPGPSCDIVQLAAVSGHHTLNLFMVPRCRMEPGASRITGFRVRQHQLFLHHRPVLTNSLKEALVSFITFLRMFGRPLLVGHNIRRFDCLVLARVLDEFDLKAAFHAGILGFLDSLPLTRQLLKDSGVYSFKQENLVKTVLGVSYVAHDALGDAQALQKLYWALRPTASQIQQHTFSLDSLCNKHSKGRITYEHQIRQHWWTPAARVLKLRVVFVEMAQLILQYNKKHTFYCTLQLYGESIHSSASSANNSVQSGQNFRLSTLFLRIFMKLLYLNKCFI